MVGKFFRLIEPIPVLNYYSRNLQRGDINTINFRLNDYTPMFHGFCMHSFLLYKSVIQVFNPLKTFFCLLPTSFFT